MNTGGFIRDDKTALLAYRKGVAYEEKNCDL